LPALAGKSDVRGNAADRRSGSRKILEPQP
jgi:hypothetical protein